jgi:formylglycine-generating enzyme required for sulfatase activity
MTQFPETPSDTMPPVNGSMGDTWTRPADGSVMVYVPAGAFVMGSAKGERDERPVHTLTLNGFWIDKYAVTNAQFVTFVNETGNQETGGVHWLEVADGDCQIKRNDDGFRSNRECADHPVVGVSWYGASAYADWVGGRLPTEAEWEKAARGTEGLRYPWGDTSPTADVCNYGYNAGHITPVGTYSPQGDSPYGCADMAGNVCEWTQSLCEDYPYDSLDGREVEDLIGLRVVRGGTFYDNARDIRCARRSSRSPQGYKGVNGFRVVMLSSSDV